MSAAYSQMVQRKKKKYINGKGLNQCSKMLTIGEPGGIAYEEFFVLLLQRFCKSGMTYK